LFVCLLLNEEQDGTAEVRQTDFAEAVVCAGGPTVLLPLLGQLDLPVAEGEMGLTGSTAPKVGLPGGFVVGGFFLSVFV
jgi:hypothetical protein